MALPAYSDLLDEINAQNVDPDVAAAALNGWRDQARAETASIPDVQERWKAVDAMDARVAEDLAAQRSRGASMLASDLIPDPAERTKFFDLYQQAGGDPKKLDATTAPIAETLNSFATDPVFKDPYEPRMMTGKIAVGDTPLARYNTRQAGDTTEVMVTPDGQEGAAPLAFSVTTPKKDDLEAAALDAEKEADRLDQRTSDILMNPDDRTPIEGLEQLARDSRDKAKALRSPDGQRILTDERIRETLKQQGAKIGESGVGAWAGDLVKGLADASFSAGATVLPSQRKVLAEAQEQLDAAIPGSTASQFQGGLLNEAGVSARRSLGQMAPYMAGAGALRLTGAVAEGIAQGSAATATGTFVGGAGGSYMETERSIRDAEQKGDTAEAERLRGVQTAHAVLTGLAEAFTEKISPLEGFQAGKGFKQVATQVLKEGVEEPITGFIERGIIDPALLNRHQDVFAQMPLEMIAGLGTAGGIAGFTKLAERVLPQHEQALQAIDTQHAEAMALAKQAGADDDNTVAALVLAQQGQKNELAKQTAQNLSREVALEANSDPNKPTVMFEKGEDGRVRSFMNQGGQWVQAAVQNGTLTPMIEGEGTPVAPDTDTAKRLEARATKLKELQTELDDINAKEHPGDEFQRELPVQPAPTEAELKRKSEIIREKGQLYTGEITPEAPVATPEAQRAVEETPGAQESQNALERVESPANANGEVVVRQADPALVGETLPPNPNATPEATSPAPILAPGSTPALEPSASGQQAQVDIPPDITAIKHAQIDSERAAMGLEPIMKQAGREFGPMIEEAAQKLAADPKVGPDLVADLLEAPRATKPGEGALLLVYKENLERARTAAAAQVNDASLTDEQRATASRRMDEATAALTNLHEAASYAGSEAGREFAFRKYLVPRDEIPPLEVMLAERQKIKRESSPGATLTADEKAEIQRTHDEMTRLKARVAELEAAAVQEGVNATAQDLAQEVMKETSGSAAQEKPETTQALDERIAAAKAKLAANKAARASQMRMATPLDIVGIHPEDLGAYLDIAGAYLQKAGGKLKAAANRMAKDFVELTKPAIDDLLNRARETVSLDTQLKKAGGRKGKTIKTVEQVRADAQGTIDPAMDIPNKLARELSKAHIAEGVTGVADLIEKVRRDLTDLMGREVTDDQVRQAVSNYGKTFALERTAADRELADYRTQMRLLESIERIQKGVPALRTGAQREKASEEVRSLQKQLRGIMASTGYRASDPTNLKGKLDIIQQSIRNQIEDLAAQLDGREPIPAGRLREEYDAETRDLQDRRNALRDELRAIPANKAVLDAQDNARATQAADLMRKEYERRVAQKEFEYTQKQTRQASAELIRARQERDAAGELWRSLRADSPEGKAEAAKQRTAALTRQVDDLEAKLRANDPKATPAPLPTDMPEQKALKERIAEVRKELQTQAYGDGMEALREWYQKRKETLEGYLRDGRPEPGDQRKKPTGAEAEAMRQEIKDLASKLKEKERPGRVLTSVQERAEKVQKQIDSLRAKTFAVARKTATPPVDTPEIRQAQQYLELLKAIERSLHKADGTLDNHLYQKTTEAKIARLEDKIAKGQFTPQKRTQKQIKMTAESEAAKNRLNDVQAKYNEGVLAAKLAARSKLKKALSAGQEALNTMRAIMTSVDFSAVLRQGGFIALGHPVRAFASMAPMFRAFMSSDAALNTMREIDNRPNADLYKTAKLFLAKEGISLREMEEAFMSRWVGKIPKSLGGGIIRGSERAYRTFLNKLRADSFDAAIAGLSSTGTPTDAEVLALGTYINMATGRGSLGKFEMAATGLNTVFFAPRYVASRFQMALGVPLIKAPTARTKRYVVGEYARYLAGVGVVYTLGRMAMAAFGQDKDEIDTDPRSGNFGKIKFGNSYLDPLSGLGQSVVLLSRTATGQTASPSGVREIRTTDPKFGQTTWWDVMTRFTRTKFSPVFGAATDILSGTDLMGVPTTPQSEALDLMIPISVQDMAKVIEDQGVPGGLALWLASAFGMGLQVQTPRHKKAAGNPSVALPPP